MMGVSKVGSFVPINQSDEVLMRSSCCSLFDFLPSDFL
jgi:hypothetical protein